MIVGTFGVTSSWCGDAYRVLLIDGASVQWRAQTPGTRVVLRYAVSERDIETPHAVNCAKIRSPASLLQSSRIQPEVFNRAAAKAFARWERVSGIAFVRVAEQAAADIVIGAQVEPRGRAYTNLTLARPVSGGMRPINRAVICLNPEQRWKIGFDGNLKSYDLVHTLTHEIGHAIGLDHPGARGHVMSFRYDELLRNLSAGDIAGAANLYGRTLGGYKADVVSTSPAATSGDAATEAAIR